MFARIVEPGILRRHRSCPNQPGGGWPSFGSVVAKVQGPVADAVPAFVGLSPKMKTSTWADNGQPGFLGQAFAPFKPNAEGMANMVLNGVTVDRLTDRKSLMRTFDKLRKEADATGTLEGSYDEYTRQAALGILTSE